MRPAGPEVRPSALGRARSVFGDQVLEDVGAAHSQQVGHGAEIFSKALKDKDLDLGKGDFAQVIAQLLEDGGPLDFVVPAYLDEAIRAVTLGSEGS